MALIDQPLVRPVRLRGASAALAVLGRLGQMTLTLLAASFLTFVSSRRHRVIPSRCCSAAGPAIPRPCTA